MRFVILLITSAILLSGCASKKPVGAQGNQFGITTSKNLIVTPDDSLVGKVAMVNQGFRFVVLNFLNLPFFSPPFSNFHQGFLPDKSNP